MLGNSKGGSVEPGRSKAQSTVCGFRKGEVAEPSGGLHRPLRRRSCHLRCSLNEKL